MREVFIGSEAVASGRLTEHELRRWYRSVYRDVYMPKSVEPSLRDRTECAWLWSKRKAVIAGVAAAALHGAQWIDANQPIELVAPSARRHEGLIVRNETLQHGGGHHGRRTAGHHTCAHRVRPGPSPSD